MKAFFQVIAWLISIPLIIIVIFVFFGFLAIRFNVWPPNCGVLPISQAKQSCEFSKLNKAPKGKEAKIIFWVTTPSNTSPSDKVFLAIEGRDLIEMEKRGVGFETEINALTGDKIKYRYFRNSENSFSEDKEINIKSYEKNIYDSVSKWSDLVSPTNFSPDYFFEIGMTDAWGMNTNMHLFEDTVRDLDSSMDRVKSSGANAVGVYSFVWLKGNNEKDFTVEEIPRSFGKRDISITGAEMKKIVKSAKEQGLKTVLHYNINSDYLKYAKVSANPFAERGSGGSNAEKMAGEDIGREAPKTEEWIDRYFSQLKNILVKWAQDAEIAGIDIIRITPQYRPPTFAPLEGYASDKMKEVIKEMRLVYKGKIYASPGGGFSTLPDYLYDVDGIIVYAGNLNLRSNATVAEMKQVYSINLDSIEKDYKKYNLPIIAGIAMASYEGVTSGKPGYEWNDYVEAMRQGYKEDWQEQATAYEAFFEALSERKFFAGVESWGFWWDDFMAPKYMDVLNNMNPTIRNKPAEAVWKKWALMLNN